MPSDPSPGSAVLAGGSLERPGAAVLGGTRNYEGSPRNEGFLDFSIGFPRDFWDFLGNLLDSDLDLILILDFDLIFDLDLDLDLILIRVRLDFGWIWLDLIWIFFKKSWFFLSPFSSLPGPYGAP